MWSDLQPKTPGSCNKVMINFQIVSYLHVCLNLKHKSSRDQSCILGNFIKISGPFYQAIHSQNALYERKKEG